MSIVDFPDIRHAFTSHSPNKTPITPQRLPHQSEPVAQDDMEMQASVGPLPAQQMALEKIPFGHLHNAIFGQTEPCQPVSPSLATSPRMFKAAKSRSKAKTVSQK